MNQHLIILLREYTHSDRIIDVIPSRDGKILYTRIEQYSFSSGSDIHAYEAETLKRIWIAHLKYFDKNEKIRKMRLLKLAFLGLGLEVSIPE